jgi:ferredoxin-NADP reductase
MARRRKAELMSAHMMTPSERSLVLRLHDRSAVGHKAGQYLDAIVPTPQGLPFRRSYSIASATDLSMPERFELAVTRVEGGPTSNALHTIQPGALIEIEGPEGTFVRRPEDRDQPTLFVATGTGLAPVRAMLSEEVRVSEGPPLVLLFGCRTPADVLWADELQQWERLCPRFRLHVTLSRASPEWAGLVGYVQRHARGLAESLPRARAYVCGVSAMVDDVVTVLEREAGLPRESLRYETYD